MGKSRINISVEHPTDRSNFYIVHTPHYAVAFSYRIPIGFNRFDGNGWIVRENSWGPTTGKHLNYLDDGDKSGRVEGEAFEDMVREATEVEYV